MSLDEERLERVSAATTQALAGVEAEVARLSTVELTGTSRDGRVMVRVTGPGRVTELWLRDGVLHRNDTSSLGELLSRTIRDAQRRARADYDAAVSGLVPPELAINEEELLRVWRD